MLEPFDLGSRYRIAALTALTCLACLSAPQPPLTQAEEVEAKATTSRIGRRIDDFSLRDFRGREWSLNEFREKPILVVAFMGTECPLARLYAARLRAAHEKYEPRGVGLIAVNSNQQDSLTELEHFARVHEIEFPMLKDPGNRIADAFGAERTPEIFVLDRERRVVYHGRVDDQYTYGIQRTSPEREDLIRAIEELLEGKPVSVPETEVVGCHIGRVLTPDDASPVTYSNQISRILQRRCVECHREGEIAPFALTDYEETVGWAEMIAEVVRTRRMPPWHADSEHGSFANDARLTDEERTLIQRWVDAGAPEGDRSRLPKPREFTVGWRIEEPDKVVYMKSDEFDVPARGEVKYQYFMVDPGFEEDVWIRQAECRPGNRAVVHHIIVAVVPPGGRRNPAHGERSDWLAATAPGARPLMLPDGMAKLIPAGSRLVFQMHYTPIGTPQKDRSSIGLVLADPRTVKRRVLTHKAANTSFRIPPGKADHRVEANYVFRDDSLMLAMFPHMHLRGSSFRYTAQYPDGSTELLLDVPRYDFNWQNSYVFHQPKSMPAGTKIHCVAHFDNSDRNLANPDPTKSVRWGDQTWEEMMIGYFDMARADQDLTQKPQRRTDRFLEQFQDSPPEIDESLERIAQRALETTENFSALADALKQVAPQLDRVCWITVDEDKLHVRRVSESVRATREGMTLPKRGLKMTELTAGTETRVIDDLRAVRNPDIRFMAGFYGSSMHVPLVDEGQASVLSFWSAEKEAFPAEAARWLTRVARLVADREAGR